MKKIWTLSVIFLILTLTAISALASSSEQVLYSFTSADFEPGGVIFDNQGNAYGVATVGGKYNAGAVFELSPSANGWTETVLYNFTGGLDGGAPINTESLVFDKAGNLYGTTNDGGSRNAGTVFRLSRSGNGTWTEAVIHSFLGNPGAYPHAGLVFDAAGNLFGTTFGNGGTVFEISPAGNSAKFRVIHTFNRAGDGSGPSAALAIDANGNVYGTTYHGGAAGFGTVFKLTPTLSGGWSYRRIYNFQGGTDGQTPEAKVLISPSGVVYGTTVLGGISGCDTNNAGCGTVFQLSPNSDGTYKHTVLHAFAGYPSDGDQAATGLILDASGNLFGTTTSGGAFNRGIVYELVPNSGWQETVLYNFAAGDDAQFPDTDPVMDSSGNIFGTTLEGGTIGGGALYEVTP
jgi:uncharacterized repeat protein (TIGR03803 family)